MSLGLVGRKRGMTRVFTDAGEAVPVTVIEALPNRVTQVKTIETDGYRAVQIASGVQKPSRLSKALIGHYAKSKVEPGNTLAEFRLGANKGADLVAGALVVVLWGHTIFLGKFASFWGVHTALMAAVLVYLVATEPRLSAALLSSRVLTFLGRISFSLYLFHVPVMFLIGMLCASWSPDSAACSALVTTIAVAWMSFRVVEIPGRRLVLAAVAGADRIPAWHRQQRSAAP